MNRLQKNHLKDVRRKRLRQYLRKKTPDRMKVDRRLNKEEAERKILWNQELKEQAKLQAINDKSLVHLNPQKSDQGLGQTILQTLKKGANALRRQSNRGS